VTYLDSLDSLTENMRRVKIQLSKNKAKEEEAEEVINDPHHLSVTQDTVIHGEKVEAVIFKHLILLISS